MSKFQCEIVTPEEKFYSGEAEFVVLPAEEGEMGVYAQHQPIVTTLSEGLVRVTSEESSDQLKIVVSGGYAQISADKLVIMASRAVRVEDINQHDVEDKVRDLQNQIADLPEDDSNLPFMQGELAWNELLLRVR